MARQNRVVKVYDSKALTCKEYFEELRREAEDVIKCYEKHDNYMLHISGTKYGIDKMKAYLKRYHSDTLLDLELGVIDKEKAEFENEVYLLLDYSFKRALER